MGNFWEWAVIPPCSKRLPKDAAPLPRTVQIKFLETSELHAHAQALRKAHHYLGGVQAVGEQLHYTVSDA
mgnify:CR=1 FL=1